MKRFKTYVSWRYITGRPVVKTSDTTSRSYLSLPPGKLEGIHRGSESVLGEARCGILPKTTTATAFALVKRLNPANI